MGRVFQRKGKKGNTWYIEYYHQGRQYREKVGCKKDGITESIAKEALKSREGDIVKDKFDLAKTKIYPLFSKLTKEYLDYSKTNKKANSYRRDVIGSKHLISYFGNKRINEINTWQIDKYKKKRKEEIKAKHPGEDERDISYASINREITLMKTIYYKAIEWGKVDKNPVKGIKMFQEKPRERYLDKSEVRAFLKACEKSDNSMLKVIVLTALNTGTRLQETLNIKVEDLDFLNSLIYLSHTKNGDRGKVYMNDFLKEILREHIGERQSGYLFHDKNGKSFKSVRTSFKTALNRAGIKDFRFHDQRHTWASHLTMNGVDSLALQDLGRWKTGKMVQRYAHLSPNYKKKAVNTLVGLFEGKDNLSTNFETMKIANSVIA